MDSNSNRVEVLDARFRKLTKTLRLILQVKPETLANGMEISLQEFLDIENGVVPIGVGEHALMCKLMFINPILVYAIIEAEDHQETTGEKSTLITDVLYNYYQTIKPTPESEKMELALSKFMNEIKNKRKKGN